jgi:hypothetical protein
MARFLYTIFFLLSFCEPSGCPLQAQIHKLLLQSQPANEDARSSDLAVNAEILKQTYCHTDLETFSVQISIKLRFTNVSDHNVIISRTIENPAIIRVAKTLEDAHKGDFEFNPNYDDFPGKLPPAPQFGTNPDPKYFAILAPKASYETTVTSVVVGAVDVPRPPRRLGVLLKGDHVLQLGVSTWPYQWPDFVSSANTQELAERWAADGRLATNTVFSNFAHFNIPEKFANPRCGP